MLVVLGEDEDLKAGRAKERREGTVRRGAQEGGSAGKGRDPLGYRWRELPQVSFLLRQKFRRDKHVFVANKVCLPRQNFCCDKIMFVATNTTNYVCRDKHDKIMFVETNISFVATKICFSRQAFFCRDKRRIFCLSQQNLSRTKLYLW